MMNQAKDGLREKYRAVRLAMSREEVETKSRQICYRLLSEIDWADVKSLLIYEPIKNLNEVELSVFLAGLKKDYPNIKVDAVKSDPDQPPPQTRYDLILAPVLAFDKDRYRLGWGGGWYDRFLASQPQAQRIGLSFQSGLANAGLPSEAHDVRLDKIITQNRTY
jgi:5-formyltetrahydrofolate cyclo-ligase